MDPSSDSNSDILSQRRKEEEKKKNDQQDLSKMTLRQKQVYLQQISQQESNNIDLGGQTGIISSESLGPPQKPEIPRRVRKHKTITLEEQTENQRKALSKILEEMNRREKERDERQKQQKATRDK